MQRSGSDVLEEIAYSQEELARLLKKETEILRQVAGNIPGTLLLDPKPYFLVGDIYPVVKDDYPLLKDTGHLNWWGGLQTVPMFDGFFEQQAAAITR